MMDTECRFKFAGAVRALSGRRLEILAAPYGSPTDRDHLNEWFSAPTSWSMGDNGQRSTSASRLTKMSVKPTSNVIRKAHIAHR
jgi:hypothetical protein